MFPFQKSYTTKNWAQRKNATVNWPTKICFATLRLPISRTLGKQVSWILDNLPPNQMQPLVFSFFKPLPKQIVQPSKLLYTLHKTLTILCILAFFSAFNTSPLRNTAWTTYFSLSISYATSTMSSIRTSFSILFWFQLLTLALLGHFCNIFHPNKLQPSSGSFLKKRLRIQNSQIIFCINFQPNPPPHLSFLQNASDSHFRLIASFRLALSL